MAPNLATERINTIMDLHNNAVGRSLSRFLPIHYFYNKGTRSYDMPHIEDTDAQDLCSRALYGGGLWVIQNGRVQPYQRHNGAS